MADRGEMPPETARAEDGSDVQAVLAHAKAVLPSMPPDFWHDLEILLIAWHRSQRWRWRELSVTSVVKYARLCAAFYAPPLST